MPPICRAQREVLPGNMRHEFVHYNNTNQDQQSDSLPILNWVLNLPRPPLWRLTRCGSSYRRLRSKTGWKRSKSELLSGSVVPYLSKQKQRAPLLFLVVCSPRRLFKQIRFFIVSSQKEMSRLKPLSVYVCFVVEFIALFMHADLSATIWTTLAWASPDPHRIAWLRTNILVDRANSFSIWGSFKVTNFLSQSC